MSTNTNENCFVDEAAEIAGQVFDDYIAQGYTHVLIRGQKATFARPDDASQVYRIADATPAAYVIPMRLPASRITFICWSFGTEREV